MNVRELCQRKAVTILPSNDLIMAAKLMRQEHIGFLVVVEPAPSESTFRPIGVLTDRDIVVSVIAKEISPDALQVRDIMTRHPVTIMGSDSLIDAVQQMRGKGVRRLPVIGDQGELAGVLSLDDVLAHLAEQLSHAAGAISHERRMEFGARC